MENVLRNAPRDRMSDGLPRVLHVEDDADLARVVASLCNGMAEFENVATLAEAHERIEQERYQLVILDTMLPDGNGLDLLQVLERTQAATRVLIFSARETDEIAAREVCAALVKLQTSNERLLSTIQGLLQTA